MKPGATQLTVMPREATSCGQRLGHADHAGLGGGVVGLAGIAGDADHRGDADDAARSAASSCRAARRAIRRKAAVRLTSITCLPVLVLHAHGEAVAGDAGVGDQDVELRPAPPRPPDQACRRSRLGEVAGDDGGAARRARRPAPRARRRGCRRAPPSRPGACSARAIAPPMPPEAPVTRAVLPVRSNIDVALR